MQEEVEIKAVTLAINVTKMTARALKNAISKYLTHLRNESLGKAKGKPTLEKHPHGKQSVKKLIGQGQGISNIEITDNNIKSFERVARKYGVDFALKKDTTGEVPRYLVFFKGKDADALTAAFKEYSAKLLTKEKKPSVLAMLQKFNEMVKASPKKDKKREMER